MHSCLTTLAVSPGASCTGPGVSLKGVLPDQVIHTIAASMAVDMRGRVLVGEFEAGAELYRVEVGALIFTEPSWVPAPGSLPQRSASLQLLVTFKHLAWPATHDPCWKPCQMRGPKFRCVGHVAFYFACYLSRPSHCPDTQQARTKLDDKQLVK